MSEEDQKLQESPLKKFQDEINEKKESKEVKEDDKKD